MDVPVVNFAGTIGRLHKGFEYMEGGSRHLERGTGERR